MQTTKESPQTNSSIKKELMRLFEEDESVRLKLVEITREQYTEDRFDRMLKELKADRERDDKRWAVTQKEWNAKWEKNEKKWQENQRVINEMLVSIKGLDRRIESSIGALGARWELHSEASFRNGLRAILEESFKVKVERYEDYDEQGTVHGRPDQVELDLIVYNDSLIICEIKSSISKSEMYTFWRKKEFYENRRQRKANRIIVISPMVDPRALKVSEELGIEVYSYPENIALKG